jgi:5,10-methylenetetrahydromethanopterin reductase
MLHGEVFPVVGARLGFQTEQRVPIFLAARGPRMLELAGEVADGVITHGLAGPYFALVAERVKAGATLAGRTPETCEISVMVEVALGDREEALDALRPRCRFMVGGNYDESLIPLYGLDPAPVMRLRAAVRARDPNAIRLIDEAMVDAFCFAGPERIVEGLGVLESMGVDSVILSPGTSVGNEGIRELGRIVHEVRA